MLGLPTPSVKYQGIMMLNSVASGPKESLDRMPNFRIGYF
jgi:hypothetical protein